MTHGDDRLSRRQVLRKGVRAACAVGLGGAAAALARRGKAGQMLWQIDPTVCMQCGKCATNCVLEVSAVRCVQYYPQCGYCDLCFGYFTREMAGTSTGGESQLCPTGAIGRRYVEDPYYEYNINEELCIGCAKCVELCRKDGNGSLILQVRHDRCLNCNDCSIAAACPSQAFRRVPADRPYLLPQAEGGGE